MKTPLRIIVLTFILGFTLAVHAQTSVNYLTQIKNYDLSKLWRGDNIAIEVEGEKSTIPFPEPLGFIGDNFQRFYIHYTSVKKSKDNPYQYIVSGKTKIKDNICSFNGTITVNKAMLNKKVDFPGFKQGTVICDVLFFEDSTKASGGTIKGRLTSQFALDKNNKIQYDALELPGDGFANNQCEATWISYKKGTRKKCNWGDFRMPDSGDLDGGAGEVSINQKYLKNGWENFAKTTGGNEAEAKKAVAIEAKKWWN